MSWSRIEEFDGPTRDRMMAVMDVVSAFNTLDLLCDEFRRLQERIAEAAFDLECRQLDLWWLNERTDGGE